MFSLNLITLPVWIDSSTSLVRRSFFSIWSLASCCSANCVNLQGDYSLFPFRNGIHDLKIPSTAWMDKKRRKRTSAAHLFTAGPSDLYPLNQRKLPPYEAAHLYESDFGRNCEDTIQSSTQTRKFGTVECTNRSFNVRRVWDLSTIFGMFTIFLNGSASFRGELCCCQLKLQ